MKYGREAGAAGDSGYFCGRMMRDSVLQTYTLPEALHRLERGMLGSRWGVCWPVEGGVSAGWVMQN